MSNFNKKIFRGLFIMAAISPIGLFLPAIFKSGDAWGEWDKNTVKELVGYVPKGMERLSELWNSPIPDYSFKGVNDGFMLHFSYVISAFLGIFFCLFSSYLIMKIIKNVKDQQN